MVQIESGSSNSGSVMECNKEEAIRAKEIAEKKMENKDFASARKIAIKAQQLYPDLENISQMIMVCDVHCSAENKVNGSEKDWYGILKIEPTADEASIKKQYRKFALLLHPDKNQFAGATDAFKLIGEAQRLLLDREKRMLHDSKCKAAGRSKAPNRPPQQASRPSNVGRPPWVSNNFTSNATSDFLHQQRQQPQQQTQSGFFDKRPTFWTVCPFCSVRYQFYKEVVNKLLCCQSCKKSFTGYEMNAQGATPGSNWSQPAFSQQKEVQNQGPFKVGLRSNFEKSTSNAGFQGNVGCENARGSIPKTGCPSEVGEGSKPNAKCENVGMNGKKRKQVAESSESSESCDTGSSTASEEDIVIEENGDHPAGQNFGGDGERYPRRSTRSKRNVSYSENLSDDDDVMNPSKREKCSGSLHATEPGVEDPSPKEEVCDMDKTAGLAVDMEENKKEVKQEEPSSFEERLHNGGKETKKDNVEGTVTNDDKKSSEDTTVSSPNSSPNAATDPEIYEYPDPDFSDFDKDRKEECFAVGQIWAVYDTVDAMPRFYVRIRKLLSPGFKLRITWLEPDPDDDEEIEWVNEGLPVSCGKFRHGSSEDSEDHPMFSHLVCWEKGSGRDTYKIYPRKGETWALFKNWDIKWHSDPDSKRKYEFEFVEVLSEYDDAVGVCVAYLVKVKGFACLFCRTMEERMDSVQIPPKELFRLSHRVPSFQMTGKEREDVPKGSFELDPASLPAKLEGIFLPENVEMEAGEMHPNGSCSKCPADMVEPMTTSEGNVSTRQADLKSQLDSNWDNIDSLTKDHSASPAFTPQTFEVPEPEFYDFDANKSPEKFHIGQIWALYSDEDGLPKYYGQIKKIDTFPEFELHVTWLYACSPPKDMIQWHHKTMTICCGWFKLKKGKSQKYTGSASFSHQLRTEITDKKDMYGIFPRKGDVWALYKNWNAGMTSSDLEKCQYDMVEVLEENASWIVVLVLELVNGFKSVFKAQMEGQSTVTMKIPRAELLRFSHQIPAFRLTEERGGSLKGFWELDPSALPVVLFSSS